jgi:hypothetical protein
MILEGNPAEATKPTFVTFAPQRSAQAAYDDPRK